MPLYEYECASCQKIHEVIQKFSDEPLTQCPDCSAPVSKRMSMTSFSLKGTGWYTTDYKRSSSSSSSSAAAPAASKASENSGTGGAAGSTPPASGSSTPPASGSSTSSADSAK